MPFIQGTAAGKVALSPFLNFRAEHYWVPPPFTALPHASQPNRNWMDWGRQLVWRDISLWTVIEKINANRDCTLGLLMVSPAQRVGAYV